MTNLSDISGSGKLVEILREHVVEPIKNNEPGAGRRIIIYGPPGTGKTFVAKAIAGELGLEFMRISPSDSPQYVGDTVASASNRTLLFYDEIEKVMDNPLLTDSIRQMPKDVTVIGATNFPWKISRLANEGFNSLVFLPEPDFEARKGILKHFLKDDAESVDLDRIAEMTEGCTAAGLYKICNLAKGKETIISESVYETASNYTPTTIKNWLIELKANKGSMDEESFKPMFDWLKKKSG
ncbi:MAG: ATP-binding protein [Candidatus Altiarchaeota archaeon]